MEVWILTWVWAVCDTAPCSSCTSHWAGPRPLQWQTVPPPESRWTGGPPAPLLQSTAQSEATHGTSWSKSLSPTFQPARVSGRRSHRHVKWQGNTPDEKVTDGSQRVKNTKHVKKTSLDWRDAGRREEPVRKAEGAREDVYPIPLSVLVQENDDQLGEHLVALFAEWQVSALKCDVHEVPDNEKLRLSYKYQYGWQNAIQNGQDFDVEHYLFHMIEATTSTMEILNCGEHVEYFKWTRYTKMNWT